MRTREIEANGLTFRAREHGAADMTPVLLLHGFPETSRMWQPLMERLAGEGFHCLAPDQRGYSPGGRPADASDYTIADFAADIVGFLDAMGWQRAHLIGHDWGALAGWAAVGTTPDRFQSWTSLSVPHIRAFNAAFRDSEEQREKSGYVNLFRQVGTAETALSQNDFAALRGIYKDTHSPAEIDEYIALFSDGGALTAALNWYRGSEGVIWTDNDPGVEFGPVATPTLHIWGNQDMALGREATVATRDYMTGPYELLELDCGHWIVQEAFDQVVEPIVAHLRAYSWGASPVQLARFAEIEDEFMKRVSRIGQCIVATVDRRGRPRSRIVNAIWEGSTGWIATRRHSFKAKHLERNPYVSLTYWDREQQQQIYADCKTEWEERIEEKRRVWELYKNTPPPLGYDPSLFFKRPEDPEFGLLKLTPWRIELWSLAEVLLGTPPQVWQP